MEGTATMGGVARYQSPPPLAVLLVRGHVAQRVRLVTVSSSTVDEQPLRQENWISSILICSNTSKDEYAVRFVQKMKVAVRSAPSRFIHYQSFNLHIIYLYTLYNQHGSSRGSGNPPTASVGG